MRTNAFDDESRQSDGVGVVSCLGRKTGFASTASERRGAAATFALLLMSVVGRPDP
jgi:hypothetical protein